jgi:uncharacterized membrane protein
MIIIIVLVLGLIFAVIDAIWLKLASALYQKEIGPLLLKKPNMVAAVIFYVIYTVGIALLVVSPAITEHWSVGGVLLHAALVGGLAYATYDLTNLATLKGWSARLVLIDIVWGIFVTSASSIAAFLLLTSWFLA